MPLSALLEDAARGRLPEWSRTSTQRFEHMQRVARLMAQWAAELKLDAAQTVRWAAAGYLHDALRECPPEELRAMVPAPLQHLAGNLLHGPAAAQRLRQHGIDDEPLLQAVAFHTVGHPELDDLGRCLFIADYIEPGRTYQPAQIAVLRARMPGGRRDVLRAVLQARLQRVLAGGRPLQPETVAFWNRVNGAPSGAEDVAK